MGAEFLPANGSASGSAGPPLVSARNLVKEYAQGRDGLHKRVVHAVADVSFEIAPGETFGLVGETGSGKSTVGRLVLAIQPPTSGTVVFDGHDLGAVSPAELRRLRRRMQVVFQDPVGSLNRRKTVQQAISSPLSIHGIGGRQERRQRVADLLEMVGLSRQHATRYPSELSIGQCQRVAIARGLALEPSLLVLDEPVSALDVSIQAQILNLVRELQERLGLTYLFISHDLAVVRYMATSVAVMHRGEIVEVGGRDDLFTAPRHPYTRELVEAIPEPDPALQA
jgi:ABC-type oligopeptide transport system ATPase subunit